MKLILASDLSFLLKYGYSLTGIDKDEMRIGYVTTASKVVRTPEFFENVKKEIIKNGYNFEEVDIKDKTPEQIKNFFKDKNIIHVEGGNTFYLLKVIKETGFDKMLKELLDEGRVYVGTSAGSYIMCPSIEVADWDKTGKDRCGLTDFSALNYVPFVLKVHYKNENRESIKDKIKNLNYPIRILKDGQGIVVEDGNYKFIGDEDEIKI